jgi:serine O-acetyltransferase
MRLCQEAADLHSGIARTAAGVVARVLHRWASGSAGLDLTWSTSIGGGFLVTHGWGLVISPHARIGRNVTVFNGVTIGQKDDIGEDGARRTSYPTIEDDVWVGPHAVIVGGVTVHRGSRVAPQTVVHNDVPAHSIVAGNPMRVVREDAPLDVINRVERPDRR